MCTTVAILWYLSWPAVILVSYWLVSYLLKKQKYS